MLWGLSPYSADALASSGALMACALLAGAATDAVSAHPVFRAFVFGLSVPREASLAERKGVLMVPRPAR
jgi:Kef-type K+ transport system membrane component KefB